MLKAYRYKLHPNKKQRQLLLQTLDTCRELYNMGLEQRRPQWSSQHIGSDGALRRQRRRGNVMRSLRIPEFYSGSIKIFQTFSIML
jgi:transposase